MRGNRTTADSCSIVVTTTTKATRVTLVLLGIAIVLNVMAVAWWMFLRDRPYDPLGRYPVQTVESHQVSIDGRVAVTGVKSNDSDETVHVVGELRWQSLQPPGTLYLVAVGVAERPPGCTTYHYQNPIPEPVIADIMDGGSTVWQITGTEWPIDDHGNRGEPRSYRSEPITVDVP
jgi:hypothetical protein